MSGRWWDPSGPVMPLLDPGDNPQLDVANALLAVHRAGAAALRVAGETPLVDDQTVGEALLQAQAAYAEPVAVCVSKALGDDNYGELLIRDVAEDAQATSMTLYRACVSKGVAPPLAAERAALVYGVPAQQLGGYMKVALDPRAQPVALIDTADRALIAWANQAAEAEIESVSKAETPEQRRQATEHEARSARGRWARIAERDNGTKIGGLDANDWLAAQMQQAETVGPAEVATPTKRARKLRKVRRVVARDEPTAVAVKATGVQANGVKRASTKMQRVTATDVKQVLERPRLTARMVRDLPKDYTVLNGPVTAPALGADVGYAIPYDEWMDFRRAAPPGTDLGGHLFTSGALQQWAGTGAFYDSDSYDSLVETVAAKMRENPHHQDLPDDVVMPVDHEDLAELESITDRHVMNSRMDALKADYLEDMLHKEYGDNAGIIPADEVGHITALPDFHDPDRLLFVWHPPNPNRPSVARGGVTVVDVVVGDDAAHGHVLQEETRHGAGQVSLDRNIPLQVFGGEPPVSYDTALGVTRVSYWVSSADPDDFDEGFSKAYNPREPRNRRGEWAEVAEQRIAGMPVDEWLATQMQQAEPAAATPRTRKVRHVRRVKREGPAAVKASQVRAAGVTRKPLQAAQLERMKVQVAEAKAAVPRSEQSIPIGPGEQYVVLGSEDMARRLHLDGTDQQSLDYAETDWLRGQGYVAGEEVVHTVQARQNEDLEGKLLWKRTFPQTEEGLDQLKHRVNEAFATTATRLLYVQLDKIGEGPDARIEATLSDHTDPHDEGISVLRWGDTSADSLHTVHWTHQQRHVLSRSEVGHIVGSSWYGVLSEYGDAGDQTWIGNPTVDFWEIHDTDRHDGEHYDEH